MANPSLQIGNDNWAIKEDNLLGYSTAGTRFVPQPITMTRATLGTRVNPSGLVEDVALLGSEEVVNGDFASDSDWTKGTGWTISGGTANCNNTSGSTQDLKTENRILNLGGKTVKIEFTVSNYSGSASMIVTLQGTGGNDFTGINANGTYTAYASVQLSENSIDLLFKASDGWIGSIDNVSVKEATIDNLPRVDYTDVTSSLLVEPQRTNTITYSEDFSQSSWFKTSGVTLTSNYGVSPDGNNNSTRLQLSTNNEQIYDSIIHSGNTETASIYVKGTSGETIQFGVGNNISQGGTYTLNGEWQRINQQSTSGSVVIIGNKDSTATDFEIWAGQFEIGSYPTSYIKTSGGTVTRVQETYEKTGISDKIGQTEGTFFIELSKPVLSPDNYITISLNNAASNSIDNTLTIGFKNSNEYYIRLRAGGTSAFTSGNTASLANTFYKIAVSYKSTESLIYIDGSPITPNGGSLSNDFAFTATLDNLSFDLDGDDTSPFYGNVKQLQIFKTALSPSELTTLTT